MSVFMCAFAVFTRFLTSLSICFLYHLGVLIVKYLILTLTFVPESVIGIFCHGLVTTHYYLEWCLSRVSLVHVNMFSGDDSCVTLLERSADRLGQCRACPSFPRRTGASATTGIFPSSSWLSLGEVSKFQAYATTTGRQRLLRH